MALKNIFLKVLCVTTLISCSNSLAEDNFWRTLAAILRISSGIADIVDVTQQENNTLDTDRLYINYQHMRFDSMIDAIGYATVHTISFSNAHRLDEYIHADAHAHWKYTYPYSFILQEVNNALIKLNQISMRRNSYLGQPFGYSLSEFIFGLRRLENFLFTTNAYKDEYKRKTYEW